MQKTITEHERDTRQRLINAAMDVFADQGFRATTVREICSRAGANVAAVNYHFGGKEDLYRAAFDNARASAEKSAYWLMSSNSGSPEDQLRQIIKSHLFFALREESHSHLMRMMSHELVEPSPIVDYIIEQALKPRVDWIRRVVAKLLGPGADEEVIKHCHLSIVGQCAIYHQNLNFIRRIYPDMAIDRQKQNELVEHIYTFSVAGLKAAAAGSASEVAE